MVPYPEPPHATSYQGASHAVFFVPTCLLIFLPSYKPQCYSVWNKTVLPTSLPTFNSLWPRLTYQIGIASFIQIAPGPLQHFSQPRIRKSDSSSCSHFTVAQIGFFPFQIHLAVLKICVNSLLRCPSLLFLTWKTHVATWILFPHTSLPGAQSTGVLVISLLLPWAQFLSLSSVYCHRWQHFWSLISDF